MLLSLRLDRKLISSLDGLLILCYHSVPIQGNWYYDVKTSDFEKHLKYLSDRFEIIRAIDFVNGKKEEGSPMIALTFDDGYENNFSNLHPLLLKNDIPATIFVTTDYLQEKKGKIIEPEAGLQKKMLTWKQLRELSESSLVDIGSHGVHHIEMSKLAKNELLDELINSKLMLESLIETEVSLFAYPGGFFNNMTTRLLRQAGYKGGFTSLPRINDTATNKYEIGRIAITKRQSDVPSFSYLIVKILRELKD